MNDEHFPSAAKFSPELKQAKDAPGDLENDER